MGPTMSCTTRSLARSALSSQWEDDIRQTLDDLATSKDAKRKLEEVLRSLSQERQQCQANISVADGLEIEALQSGLLLDLIDEDYKPAKTPDDATERTFKAIEQIKVEWGRDFYATLRQNSVFLPTRLSRDSASQLRGIAKAFTITEFCTAIKPLLEQPKKKGKKQERVPPHAQRVVQISDITAARSALKKALEANEPSSIPAADPMLQLDADHRNTEDREIEEPRRYSSVGPQSPEITPITCDDLYASTTASSALGREDNHLARDSPSTPFRVAVEQEQASTRSAASTPVNIIDGHESHYTKFVSSASAPTSPDCAIMGNGKRKWTSELPSELVAKHRRKPISAVTKTDLQSELLDSSVDESGDASEPASRLPKLQIPPSAAPSLSPPSHTYTPPPRATSPSARNSNANPNKDVGGQLQIEGFVQPKDNPQDTQRQEVNNLIVQDLAPKHKLHGSTVNELIRTFLPQSLVKVLELNDVKETRSAVSACIENGTMTGTYVVGTLCSKEHWIGVVFNSELNTLSLIDSYVGHVQSQQWVDHFSLGLADAGCANHDRTAPQTSQQPNLWDCGIYLVVSLLRAVASEKVPSPSPRASPAWIDGPFWRIIFTNHLMAGDSARLSSSALVALEGSDCIEGFNIATRLKRSKALSANLEV
jgi:hypothetical protein